MKKRVYIMTGIVLLCISNTGFSQLNTSVFFNPHNNSLSSYTFPGKAGRGFEDVEIILPSINFDLTNNFVGSDHIRDVLRGGDANKELEQIVSMFKDENVINIGTDVHVLGVFFNIRDKTNNGKTIVSFSFTYTEKFASSFRFSRNLALLIYEGNSQFAGQWVDLSPLGLDLLAYHDLACGMTFPVEIEHSNSTLIELRPGFRIRYLNAYASVETQYSELLMFTETTGDYIQFDFEYDINTSFPGDDYYGGGHGFALDLGSSLILDDIFEVDLSFTDIGFIHFSRNARNLLKDRIYTYEGIEVDIFDEELTDLAILDTLRENFRAEDVNEDYSVSLSPALYLMGSVKLSESVRKDQTYYRHNLYFLYKQGFRNSLNKSTIPLFGFGYTYSVGNIFNIGPSMTFGGYPGVAAGLHTSVKAGVFRFSLGSADLLPLLDLNNGKGANLQMSFALQF